MGEFHVLRLFKPFTIITCLSILAGCWGLSDERTDPFYKKLSDPPTQNQKQVILLIIDSLMDKPLQDAIKNGRAPALQFLVQHGHYFPNVVSSFPTMSVTIESSLLTGTYPNRHHIPGLVWYNKKENRMVNYGNGKREILKVGAIQVLKDSLYRLNNVHLNQDVKTIHEELGEKGKQSASINSLVYRGNTPHLLNIPKVLAFGTSFPEELKTYGPHWLSLGSLSQLDPANQSNSHAWQSFGMNDKFASQELIFLIRRGDLPPFTIVYFPTMTMRFIKTDRWP
jgi:predicted AlkP superfamily pyrophosphatase or phosphodiesterase